MSLGVLNNLSAMYAAHNLSNSNNSLSKTLQQLSSGSKINSGSDDAAGLSLVNGLQANATALAQSQTNAQEGVGLLQVADGALSQVTNLLNRAVTLATEVSNGTLNGAQQSAANQEYQSILSEINNIGSTTTFNQQKVFGTGAAVGIYTGDSSTQGASLNNLNITALSSSHLGDTGGQMSYTTGSNVFLDLSNGTGQTTNASLTDSIKSTTLTITYENPDATTQTVVTTAATTVGGLINAINASGRGLSATFTSRAAAGAGGTGTDMGIMISGPVSTAAVSSTVQNIAITTGGWDTTQLATAASALANGGGGIASINYTATGTTNLSGTDLTSQGNAETALTSLNSAIASVAAQDGYIGAQINTLNAVANVMSTQQENIVGAQNAVQATDYASAASAMSKYQILSQTGISALAQANSAQQEVLKLLQ